GHLPKFEHWIPSIKDPDDKIADKHLAHHFAVDWHFASIRLAGRIWGNWQWEIAALTNTCGQVQ
ncbi:hypothetical protein B0H14DRAFT_2368581, partial [Mycena olivaceomarginata]